jgi:hypothetical protein
MNIWYHRIYKILFAAGPKLINFCLGIIICFHSIQLKAQILRDSQAIDILRNGMQKVYNLEFKEAESIYNTLSNLYPGHPVLSLFNGMKIYWENFPILSSSPASLRFESEMNKCIGSSEMEDYPSPEYEAEYLLHIRVKDNLSVPGDYSSFSMLTMMSAGRSCPWQSGPTGL